MGDGVAVEQQSDNAELTDRVNRVPLEFKQVRVASAFCLTAAGRWYSAIRLHSFSYDTFDRSIHCKFVYAWLLSASLKAEVRPTRTS